MAECINAKKIAQPLYDCDNNPVIDTDLAEKYQEFWAQLQTETECQVAAG